MNNISESHQNQPFQQFNHESILQMYIPRINLCKFSKSRLVFVYVIFNSTVTANKEADLKGTKPELEQTTAVSLVDASDFAPTVMTASSLIVYQFLERVFCRVTKVYAVGLAKISKKNTFRFYI